MLLLVYHHHLVLVLYFLLLQHSKILVDQHQLIGLDLVNVFKTPGTGASTGSLSGTLTVTASSGIATWNTLSIDKSTPTNYTITVRVVDYNKHHLEY